MTKLKYYKYFYPQLYGKLNSTNIVLPTYNSSIYVNMPSKTIYRYFMYFAFFTANAQPQDIEAIHKQEQVLIGGILQTIDIKGSDINNPILLFLHGGPGTSLIPVSESFTQNLQKHFLVVQWDQRQTGSTLIANVSPEPLTTALLQSDAHEMVSYLLKNFNKPKLYLASHSWGSILGFDIASKNPEQLYAYICISGLIDQDKNARLTIDMLNNWAKENANAEAQEELSHVKVPYKTPDDLFYAQKWLFIHNGVEFAKEDNFKPTYYRWLDVWFPTWLASVQNNRFNQQQEFHCPIYFFEGNGDQQQSHYIVEDYYNWIKAPKKDFFWFTNSGHTIFNTEPDKIQSTLIERILPETN